MLNDPIGRMLEMVRTHQSVESCKGLILDWLQEPCDDELPTLKPDFSERAESPGPITY